MGQRLAYRVRILMMRALLRQEVGWYDQEKNSSGVLTSKLSTDALAVKGQFGDTMGLLTQVGPLLLRQQQQAQGGMLHSYMKMAQLLSCTVTLA